jgi:TldD protein
VRDLCRNAVDAAVGAGASYADARAVFRRSQSVATKNAHVESVSDVESEGIGVRVLVDGAWGFAGDRRLTDEGAPRGRASCVRVRDRAGRRARGEATRGGRAADGHLRDASRGRPFLDLARREDRLLPRRGEGLARPEVKVAEAFARAQLERKVLVSSEGADVEQELVESGAGIDATAVGDGLTQLRSYPSAFGGLSAQAGWEYVLSLGLADEAERVGEQAAALLRAPECPAGVMDVVIDAEQVALQLHESVGHPTELDRVLGFEAAYAGTSFSSQRSRLPFATGPQQMNVTADPTTPSGLGTFAFDDEGVPAQPQPIVREGVLVGWLGSREVGFPGSMRADGWSRMPLVRMTNLHLEPARDRSRS